MITAALPENILVVSFKQLDDVARAQGTFPRKLNPKTDHLQKSDVVLVRNGRLVGYYRLEPL